MQLSAHFTLAELTRSTTAQRLGLDNTPPEEVMPRLVQTAEMLERIRAALNAAKGTTVRVNVTSGFRGQAVNRAVGGVATSDHTRGDAADWVAPAFGSPHQVCKFLAPRLDSLGIGQVIYEAVRRKDGTLSEWVHTSTRTPERLANRVITITEAGTMLGIQEVVA